MAKVGKSKFPSECMGSETTLTIPVFLLVEVRCSEIAFFIYSSAKLGKW